MPRQVRGKKHRKKHTTGGKKYNIGKSGKARKGKGTILEEQLQERRSASHSSEV